jgi:flagellar assembly protein FliH
MNVNAYAFPALELAPERLTPATATEAAARIVARAEAEAEAITAAAVARGHEEGFAAGLAEARDHIVPALDTLVSVTKAVEGAQQELASALEARAVDLAVAIAEKIVGTTLSMRPELIVDIVKGALRRVVERERLTIYVNPADLPTLQAALAEIASSFGGVERLDLAAERRVPMGGCLVRTVDGELDARVLEQLERAGEILRDAVGRDRD